MINFQGKLLAQDESFLSNTNRGLRYGDALFETLRVVHGKIYFWEDHYFRLMASMRMVRMEIPMSWTMEFLEAEILKTLEANQLQDAPARVRLTVFRGDGGYYLPENSEAEFIAEAHPLENPFYILKEDRYEMGLYKDFYLNADLLTTLKTANRMINVVGSVFAKENGYQNCFMINQHKHIVEALNANVFLVSGNTIRTASLEDGCLNGIIRMKLIEILKNSDEFELEETSISPFELQKADEIFLTNSIIGIRPVTHYRKAEYGTEVAGKLIGKLNAMARLG